MRIADSNPGFKQPNRKHSQSAIRNPQLKGFSCLTMIFNGHLNPNPNSETNLLVDAAVLGVKSRRRHLAVASPLVWRPEG